jgi:hypothetical protein
MKKVFLIPLSLLIFSCEEWAVESPVKKLQDLIVVNSMISPQDSLLTVYISRGEDLGKTVKLDSLLIKNAKVFISDGTNQEELSFNSKNKRYEAIPRKLKITESKKYNLEVKYLSKILTASCIVPPKVENLTVNGEIINDDYALSTRWNDTDDDRNIYLLSSLVTNKSNTILTTVNWDDQSLLENKIITSRSKNTLIYTGTIRSFKSIKYERIIIKVSSIDTNYEQYILRQSSINADEGIFDGFIEPQLNYTNVKGGAGVFGAFNLSKVEIIVK